MSEGWVCSGVGYVQGVGMSRQVGTVVILVKCASVKMSR